MSRSKLSLGSMETYEPEDKSFSKHMFQDGTGDTQPNEGSVCRVIIRPVVISNDPSITKFGLELGVGTIWVDLEDQGQSQQIKRLTASVTDTVVFFHAEGELGISEEDLGGYKVSEDCEVTLGEGDTKVSELLDKVVMSMKLGETAYIKAKIDAKGNKVTEFEAKEKGLKFNLHLYQFDRASDPTDLEQDERLDRAQHHKEKGTELYQKDRLEFSQMRYEKALKYLKDMEPATDLPGDLGARYKKLKCQCYLNLAACFLKKEEYNTVVEHCTSALELEPENVKGLFRRGQAYTKLNDYPNARADLEKAQGLDKSNKAVINQLRQIDSMVKKEKQMYQKMFSS